MTNQLTRTGFTKTGFTKAGFGCCGHFKICQMGKASCFYEKTDPEAMLYCAAYQRNQTACEKEITLETLFVTDFVQKESNVREEEGQLSLF